jgi:oxazoline/thiazoline synthase
MAQNNSEHGTARDGEIVRFAPNFSIYVLPPDIVCLYAEERKFFLHGALYCALVSAIGPGKNCDEVIHALTPDFPASAIDEAIQRLLEHRFLLQAKTQDKAAAYWASLDIMPDEAAANLNQYSVQIQSLGGAGQSELGEALRDLGVYLVERSAELTVVLVSDYLDGQLGQFNGDQLAQGQRWCLAQLGGPFSLVGPLFIPGESPCWMCLAERMRRNRQIKAFLDQQQARCVSASPLQETLLGPTPVGFAALEIAKAIVSDFCSGLQDNLVSFDLLGANLIKHHVTVRPQCPSCGRSEWRDPQRSPIPIRLHAGGRMVATGEGYRAMTPAATIAAYRKHVSPLTGVISRLERIGSDLFANATYLATHNLSPRPETFEALRAGMATSSYGKGSTADQGEASALMKGIERSCGVFQGDEIRTTCRFDAFPPGEAILPNDIMLFSDNQYRLRAAAASGAADRSRAPPPFDSAAAIDWSPVWSLRDEVFRYLPTGLLYYFHNRSGTDGMMAESNGCAAGNMLEEAIVQGFLELVERDACAIWWYNRLRRSELDLEQLGDNYLTDLRREFAKTGRKIWALDITTDLKIPAVVAVGHWQDQGKEHIRLGAGAHFEPRIAALRAFTELNQRLAIDALAAREGERTGYGAEPLPLHSHAYLRPHGKGTVRSARFSRFAGLDRREQVRACVGIAKRHGFDFLVLDQTRPDIDAPVARVIVPGLRPCRRRFAPGRLYDVPVRLGLRKRPLAEAELNPIDPPF